MAVVAVLALAAGCASDAEDTGPTTTITTPPYAPQGSETEVDYVEAFVAAHGAGPDPMFAGVDIACVAPRWVATIGLDAFFAAGVTPARIASGDAGLSDLIGEEDTAGKVVDAVAECGLPLVDLYIQDLGVAVSGDPATVTCIRGAISEDQVRGALAAAIVAGTATVPTDLAGPCLT